MANYKTSIVSVSAINCVVIERVCDHLIFDLLYIDKDTQDLIHAAIEARQFSYRLKDTEVPLSMEL